MRRQRSKVWTILAASIAAAFLAPCSLPVLAASPKVYTNKDLDRLPAPMLPSTKSLSRRAAAPQPRTLSRSAEPRAADAEQRLWEAHARVLELERRLLAVRNPFVPRPQLPPEEAEAWAGLDGVARAARVEGQLERARAELLAAQERFAAIASGSR
jgi:hypothetical protein